ncbi:MAG: hypothetical protein LBI71_00185 [Enterobacteriaceae bacterium]|jgi:hypothetical protein|nr:hypothetical protein [Enterobacteriaceae bacterium]
MDFELHRGGKGTSSLNIDNYATGVTGTSERNQQRGNWKDEGYIIIHYDGAHFNMAAHANKLEDSHTKKINNHYLPDLNQSGTIISYLLISQPCGFRVRSA